LLVFYGTFLQQHLQQRVRSQPLLRHDLHSLLLPEPMLDGSQCLACKMLVALMLSAQGMGLEIRQKWMN
jgi:hypothetical protein